MHLADPEVIGKAISRASEDLRASIDGPHWFVTPANPARLEAATQAAADAQRKAQAYAAGLGVTLDGLICLVEPDTANRPDGIRRVSGAAGSRDMPIDVEEYEVRATIDATFALNVGDDDRERQQEPAPRSKAAKSTRHDRDTRDQSGPSVSVSTNCSQDLGEWTATWLDCSLDGFVSQRAVSSGS